MPADRDHGEPAGWPPLRELLVTGAAFGLLTILATWPQARHLATHTGTHYDALFSVWRMAWVAHQLPADPLHLFDANIFYPELNTLAYSDAVLLPALIGAPLIWMGVPPLATYNVLILLSFVAAGLGMYVLVRELTGSRASAFAAGVIFAFQPYRFAHFSHLELVWTCWIPLTLWSLHRVFRDPTWTNGFLLGLFASAQVLTSIYYGVFLATALLVVGPPLLVVMRGRHRWRLWMPFLGMVLPLILLVIPYAQPYRHSAAALGERDAVDVARWSPTIWNYLEPQDGHWLYPRLGNIDVFEGVLLPGAVVVALAAIGVWRGWRREPVTVAAYAVLLLVAFDLSLGSNGLSFGVVREIAWPYRGLRVPARMFVVVSAALSVLAGFALARLGTARWRRLIPAAAALLAFVEAASIPIPLNAAPLKPINTLDFLASRPPGPVAHWPLPNAANIGITWDPKYMYFSMYHWRPLLNGYSGYHPDSYLQFLRRTAAFPDPGAVAAMQRAGVRYLVVHSTPDGQAYIRAMDALRLNDAVAYQFSEHTIDEDVALFVLK
ncbi:MAG TPA: hypothetical protein VL263_26290 [Vicinamibacterales bacterium]|nr:hypothetical protein [Vicinamibacterales bacterium]